MLFSTRLNDNKNQTSSSVTIRENTFMIETRVYLQGRSSCICRNSLFTTTGKSNL